MSDFAETVKNQLATVIEQGGDLVVVIADARNQAVFMHKLCDDETGLSDLQSVASSMLGEVASFFAENGYFVDQFGHPINEKF